MPRVRIDGIGGQMPWTHEQVRVAQAVEHGWKPTGSAKGFSKDFATQVIAEGEKGKRRKKKAKKGGK